MKVKQWRPSFDGRCDAMKGTGVIRILFFALGALWRSAVIWLLVALVVALWTTGSLASNYAAVVMDARNGAVLHSRHANKRLHPASLTKMMTVYLAIQAVENGEIGIDQKIRISKFAAREPASKIYYKPGQRVTLRHLIRAAAVKSANDAATAIAEAISGSESAFAARMTSTARAMGMRNTTFKNAHGLTQAGHFSTAMDMSILGRHMIYDYPDYYNLFSRISTVVNAGTLRNTNRSFLRSYKGADGIKTGYTSLSGFNLTASAERSGKRIIVTVFGGRSAQSRNQHVAELMDKGFALAKRSVSVIKPRLPTVSFSRLILVDVSVQSAERRRRRPSDNDQSLAAAVLEEVQAGQESEGDADPSAEMLKTAEELIELGFDRPRRRIQHEEDTALAEDQFGGVLGVVVGRFNSKSLASNHLFRTALVDYDSLSEATRTVKVQDGKYVAIFEGITLTNAKVACGRLKAREIECEIIQIL